MPNKYQKLAEEFVLKETRIFSGSEADGVYLFATHLDSLPPEEKNCPRGLVDCYHCNNRSNPPLPQLDVEKEINCRCEFSQLNGTLWEKLNDCSLHNEVTFRKTN